MAGAATSPFKSNTGTAAADLKPHLMKQIRSHEIALAELDALPSSRAVYQKNGNLFFRTTVQKASESEKKQINLAKANVGQLNES